MLQRIGKFGSLAVSKPHPSFPFQLVPVPPRVLQKCFSIDGGHCFYV